MIPTESCHGKAAAFATVTAALNRSRLQGEQGRLALVCRAYVKPSVQTPKNLRIPPWIESPSQVQSLNFLKSKFRDQIGEGVVDEEMLKWFLRDRNGDVREAQQKLNSTLEWRKSLGKGSRSQQTAVREAKLGKAWLHDQLDVLGRPVVIMVPAKHIIGQFPLSSTQHLCADLAEEAIQRMPQGCETLLAIFDLRGFGPLNADLNLVRFLVDLFFVYYPRRLGQVLVVEAPWIFDPVWQVIKPWLRKYAGLVRFVSIQDMQVEYFDKTTLPMVFRK